MSVLIVGQRLIPVKSATAERGKRMSRNREKYNYAIIFSGRGECGRMAEADFDRLVCFLNQNRSPDNRVKTIPRPKDGKQQKYDEFLIILE